RCEVREFNPPYMPRNKLPLSARASACLTYLGCDVCNCCPRGFNMRVVKHRLLCWFSERPCNRHRLIRARAEVIAPDGLTDLSLASLWIDRQPPGLCVNLPLDKLAIRLPSREK